MPSKKCLRLICAFAVCITVGGFFISSSLSAQADDLTASGQNISVGALGWIEPKSHVLKIGAPNILEGARVEKLDVIEGQSVKKGEIVGYFSTYHKNKAAYDVAQANVALAKATLDKVIAGSKQSDIQSQQQVVQSLHAEEDAATKEFQRLQELFHDQLISKSQFDNAQGNRDRLTALRKAAEATLASLIEVRPDEVAIAKAQVDVTQAQLDVAQADMDLSTIIAPIDGTVLTIYAHDSEAVGDNGILDMGNLDVMDVVAEVDENDILKVQQGQKAEIRIPGMDVVLTGSVRELEGQIKRNSILDFNSNQILDTRIVKVRIQLTGDQNQIVSRLINKKVRVKINP